MLQGQVRDVLDRHALVIDPDRYLVVALEKTAALFACATELGGMLSDVDLVDLAGRGDEVTRVLIASRFIVSLPVCAAIAEIGGEAEIEAMLASLPTNA